MSASSPRQEPISFDSAKITYGYTFGQYPQHIYRQVMSANNSWMDKYERRRQNLLRLKKERCNDVAAELAAKIERPANYVSRMLYPLDKKGRKRIAEDMVDLVEEKFQLPRGWMDGLVDPADIPEARPSLTTHQQLLLDAIEGFSSKQITKLIKIAGWVEEGREIVARDPPIHQAAVGNQGSG